MSSAVSIETRRALGVLAGAVLAFLMLTAAAHADTYWQGTASDNGYNGLGTCTVKAQLWLNTVQQTHAMGNVSCTTRQGSTRLRVYLKRDGVVFSSYLSPPWGNSFGQGNTWYWTGSGSGFAVACASNYHPAWQAAAPAYLYDYYGTLKKTIPAATSARVLC
jgi:hypothetical protein